MGIEVFFRRDSRIADSNSTFKWQALSIIATALVSYSVTLGFGRHTAAVVAEYGMERYEKTAYWQILAFPFNIGEQNFIQQSSQYP